MDRVPVLNETPKSNWIDDLPARVKLYKISKGLIAGPTCRFDFNGEWCPRNDSIKCVYFVKLLKPSKFLMANPQTTLFKSGYV
jgi:hypothetical protein